MPTLNWIGKEKVINHHLDVPFRVLEHKYGFTPEGKQETPINSGNLILHGDNLEGLKALLPQYEGKIKCIYIDPPYNTGNENWIYNDNVNDPKIKKWLHQVVGKEGEDLSRHDKWLCMMYPRLVLLKRLLSYDGLIGISIDDNELYNLGSLMNEIFGNSNRLACAPWLSDPSGGKEKTTLRTGHEYLIIYSGGNITNLSRETKNVGELNLKDKSGNYRKGRELSKWGEASLRQDRPDMWFPLIAPDGSEVFPYRNDGKEGRWRWGNKNVNIINILKDPNYAHWEKRSFDSEIKVNDQNERWFPFEKIRNKNKAFGWNTWLDKYGYNADGTKEIKMIFGEKIFNTPKPSSLIEWMVNLHSDENSIILDSFAGSGTTAHAVLNLNKQDGGDRKFILVEMEEYAESITAERVKRVIQGYADVEGTGGSFDYYELGLSLFDDNNNLNDQVPLNRIREYIWYSETRMAFMDPDNRTSNNPYFLGIKDETGYYFFYETQQVTTLDYEFLSTIDVKSGLYVVYADNCLLSKTFMEKSNIIFKKIPRDISRL